MEGTGVGCEVVAIDPQLDVSMNQKIGNGGE
jgi:hypothetical protein